MLAVRVSLSWLIGFGFLSLPCARACVSPEACGFLSKEIGLTGRIQSTTIGDFNGDSRPDIAVRTSEDLSVLLNTTAGSFSSPVRTALPYGNALTGVTNYLVGRAEVAADFNGDGRLDLAVTDRNEILLGAGDGTFLPPQPISPAFFGLAASGDFNSDRKADLLFFVRGSVAILLGNGDGTFHVGSTVELGADGQVLVADFNRDGRSDLAYLQYRYAAYSFDPGCCAIQIFLAQEDGTLAGSGQATAAAAGALLTADFNLDGIPDLATSAVVLLGNGDGTFDSPRRFLEYEIEYETPGGPAAAADLDGDGRVDLIHFGSTEGRTIFAQQGRGDGTFVPPNPSTLWLYLWESSDRRVAGIADVDGDGRPDLITAVFCDWRGGPSCSGRSSRLSVLLNRIDASAIL
ncbi:MAG TPA: VCBS repeat-containing protein [Bryobacteraceae bacterium]|nr:VCBS repeat-containing protein [Bryobacteraceae bacterium]